AAGDDGGPGAAVRAVAQKRELTNPLQLTLEDARPCGSNGVGNSLGTDSARSAHPGDFAGTLYPAKRVYHGLEIGHFKIAHRILDAFAQLFAAKDPRS